MTYSPRTTTLLGTLALGFALLASPLAADDSPWSVAVKVGQATIDTALVPGVLGWRVDDDDTTASVSVGYAFHRNFGIEAAYHDFGSYTGLPGKCPDDFCVATVDIDLVPTFPASVDFTGLSLVAVPRWPVTQRFTLFGKLGALDWNGDVTPYFAGQSVEDPSGTDLLAGLGARLDVSRRFGLSLEYETTDLYDSLSLGASWSF